MKSVTQTIFGEPHGNCVQACIASILELELSEVPNFVEADDWFLALEDFLGQYDLQPAQLDITKTLSVWKPTGFHIIGGTSPRGLAHAVVGFAGEMIHDPHPDGCGLVAEEDWTIFVARLTNHKR